MPQSDKTSITYSFDHCKERYKERYNEDLTMDYYLILCKNAKCYIKDKKFDGKDCISIDIVSKEKNNTGEQYIIKIKTIIKSDIYVVYEMKRDCITTFLPPNNIKIKK